MIKHIRKRIRDFLYNHKLTRRTLNVFERTPTHALHWYVVLMIGIAVGVVGTIVAWSMFQSVSVRTDDVFEKKESGATLKESELNEAREIYRERARIFKSREKQTDLVDPGR